MKKLENYSKCIEALKSVDYKFAEENPIYKSGVVLHFNLAFELAWKAMKEVLEMHGAYLQTGSPREVLQCAYKYGFLDDEAVWLDMLKKRNTSVHIYDEPEINELLVQIHNRYLPALITLENTLRQKYDEANSDSLSWTIRKYR